MKHVDMVVIGSGPAGQKAAIQAAKLGKTVTLIERNNILGGACIHTGTIPSKDLRESVLHLTGYAQRGLSGHAQIKQDITIDDLIMHDERAEEPTLAYLLSRMVFPRFPECIGIFRCVERPTFDDLINHQIDDVIKSKGRGKLEDLFASDDTWTVEAK